jgi:hypothetical protein
VLADWTAAALFRRDVAELSSIRIAPAHLERTPS